MSVQSECAIRQTLDILLVSGITNIASKRLTGCGPYRYPESRGTRVDLQGQVEEECMSSFTPQLDGVVVRSSEELPRTRGVELEAGERLPCCGPSPQGVCQCLSRRPLARLSRYCCRSRASCQRETSRFSISGLSFISQFVPSSRWIDGLQVFKFDFG